MSKLKNLQQPPPTHQKFDTTSVFKKHNEGFSWQKPKKIFQHMAEYSLGFLIQNSFWWYPTSYLLFSDSSKVRNFCNICENSGLTFKRYLLQNWIQPYIFISRINCCFGLCFGQVFLEQKRAFQPKWESCIFFYLFQGYLILGDESFSLLLFLIANNKFPLNCFPLKANDMWGITEDFCYSSPCLILSHHLCCEKKQRQQHFARYGEQRLIDQQIGT